ncbi:hypothetical protein FO519_004321 [Halicephalobus sp. NKZ332]|nr:hypothetical protein FO519_004321 [Halicephalobus sp. NKZ332]
MIRGFRSPGIRYFLFSKARPWTRTYQESICSRYQLFSCSSNVRADVAVKDKFEELIDGVIDITSASNERQSSYVFLQKLRHMSSVHQLKTAIEECRPIAANEVLLFLRKLENLSTVKPNSEVMQFLKSETFTSLLSAQLLMDDVDFAILLDVGNCIMKISNSLPDLDKQIKEDDTLTLTLSFDIFYQELFKKINARLLTDDTSKLSADSVIGFYCGLRSFKGKANPNMVSGIESLVIRKVSEVQNSGTIISLFLSLNKEKFSQLNFIVPILSKIEELVPVMLLGELITVMCTLATNKCRRHELLQTVAEAIRLHSDIMTPGQLVRLSNAIRELSFYFPRLITRFGNDFVNSTTSFSDFAQITPILNLFVTGKITDETAWIAVCKWITNNSKRASHADLRFCVSACAAGNVDPSLVKLVSENLAKNLQPGEKETPRKWLNIVWSLAVLNSLTPKLADSILKESFQKALFADIKSNDEKSFIAQKLFQINAAAKFDLKGYRGSILTKLDDSVDLGPATTAKLKYGKTAPRYESFLSNMNLLIPPECRAAPSFYPEVGSFIDVLTVFNSETGKFASLKSIKKDDHKSLNGFTAVLYFDNQFTRCYSDADYSKQRPLGQFQMNIRHLQLAGARVCVMAEHDLQKCSDTVQRMMYMKQQIATPAQNYFTAPSWSGR